MDNIFNFIEKTTLARLFVLLAAESGVGIRDLDGQLSRSLHNHLPVL